MPMKVLELFCGTKSVGKVCDQLGWESISVDMEKKFNPTHLCNIMDFIIKNIQKFILIQYGVHLLAHNIQDYKTVGLVDNEMVLYIQKKYKKII